MAWWVTILVIAAFASIRHELEHDLIHKLYFTRSKTPQNIMMAVVWAKRPLTISPWSRRDLQLLHHKISGTKGDIEERTITNGEHFNLRRLAMMTDLLASALMRLPKRPETRSFVLRSLRHAFFPQTFVGLGLWYGFLAFHAVDLTSRVLGLGPLATSGVPATVVAVLNFLAVVWLLPNVLRTFCLHFISSNMHYYGGVEEGTVVEQTQVLTKWYLAPMQLFCMNFGSSHAIHHFVPGDPFYVRMMTVRVGHEVMRANGVRFNDMGRSDGRTASTPLRRHPLRRNRPGAIRSKAVHRRRVSLQSRLHVEVAESADALA